MNYQRILFLLGLVAFLPAHKVVDVHVLTLERGGDPREDAQLIVRRDPQIRCLPGLSHDVLLFPEGGLRAMLHCRAA